MRRLLLLATLASAADFEYPETLERFAFGSCNKHDFPQPLWSEIAQHKPDVWAWLGDIVYVDRQVYPLHWVENNLTTVEQIWQAQKARPEYTDFLRSGVKHILGTWDDHDFGLNNAGGELQWKELSQRHLLDFLDEPADSIRRRREGVYASYGFGEGDTRVLVIMLDVRYFRTKTVVQAEVEGVTVARSHDDMLGAAQWEWLEEQLRDPAPVKLIASGIQVLGDTPVVESWARYPQSRKRLLGMIKDANAQGVLFLSGDVHFSELTCCTDAVCRAAGYTLYDFTSSGLTHYCPLHISPSTCQRALEWLTRGYMRVGPIIGDLNYGITNIDWRQRTLTLQAMRRNHEVGFERRLRIDDLAPRPQGLDSANGCPLEDMHFRSGDKWKTTIIVAMMLFVVAGVGSIYLVARCVKAVFFPNWTAPDLDVSKLMDPPAADAAAAAALKPKED